LKWRFCLIGSIDVDLTHTHHHDNTKTYQDPRHTGGGFGAWKKCSAVIEEQAEETRYHD
jgi:fatty-acid desaturase